MLRSLPCRRYVLRGARRFTRFVFCQVDNAFGFPRACVTVHEAKINICFHVPNFSILNQCALTNKSSPATLTRNTLATACISNTSPAKCSTERNHFKNCFVRCLHKEGMSQQLYWNILEMWWHSNTSNCCAKLLAPWVLTTIQRFAPL